MLQEQVPPEHTTLHTDVSQQTQPGPGSRLLVSLHSALLARRGLVAYLPVIAAVLLLFCGASWQIFAKYADATRYQCYALIFWQGSPGIHQLPAAQCAFLNNFGVAQNNVPPFHILPFEYPPLALGIFSLILAAPLPYYQIAFAFLMALTVILIYWLLQRYGPRGAALACVFYLVLGAWTTAESRFDLVPAGLTLLCLIAAERRRWKLAYFALALAVLLKLYPLLLLPALFLAEQMARERLPGPSDSLTLKTLPGEVWQTLRGAGKWRWQNALLFFALVLAISGAFALLNFQGAVVSQLSYFVGRPVQIEATGSTLLWLGTLFGRPAGVVYSFGSDNIKSSLGSLVSLVCEACFVLGYILTILWQWRSRLDVVQTFIALLLVFMVTGKVFSTQYLIWVIPLLAYSGAFNRSWLILWSGLSLLTTAIYPYFYALLSKTTPLFIEVVALRNLLLVLVTLGLLFHWWGLSQRTSRPALSPGSVE